MNNGFRQMQEMVKSRIKSQTWGQGVKREVIDEKAPGTTRRKKTRGG